MIQDMKEYKRAWYQAHKKEMNDRSKAWNKAHKEECNSRSRDWNKAHKKELKARSRAYNKAHKEEIKEYKKADVNSLGQTKDSIRKKSKHYLNKYGTKIPGYEIHHCCSYTEPYKFIYCSKEIHLKIHQYLRDNNIEADSNHFEQIKHLLDDTVVLYGI